MIGLGVGTLNTCPPKVTAVTNHARYIPGLRYLPALWGGVCFLVSHGEAAAVRGAAHLIFIQGRKRLSLAHQLREGGAVSAPVPIPRDCLALCTPVFSTCLVSDVRCTCQGWDPGPLRGWAPCEDVVSSRCQMARVSDGTAACLSLSLAREDVDLRLDSGSVSRGLFLSPF